MKAYLDTKFISIKDAKLSVFDEGLLYGYGVFETMRSYEGFVFRLDEHVRRMSSSLKALGIPLKISKTKLRRTIYKLIEKNKLYKNAYIKIIVTKGNPKPILIVFALRYKSLPLGKGVKIDISKHTFCENSVTTGHKTLNYLNNIVLRRRSKNKGFYDVILCNTKGLVGEATASNIFFVKRKRIFTPDLSSGCLPGITRKEIMLMAKKHLKHGVKEVRVKVRDLYNADEVFLTNSLTEIVPVVKIGRKTIKNGKPGSITERLIGLYKGTIDKTRYL